MGGGEAGAGRCERCGQIGAVHQLSWVYLCAECRKVYKVEAMRKKPEPEKARGPVTRQPK